MRSTSDTAAAGFMTFLAGESLLLSGNAAGLVMVSASNTFALWMRLTALVAAMLFVVSAGMILWGAPLLPISAPLPAVGYPFLVLTFVGWIRTLVREGR
ncbi:hypothetical protein [Mesorhizobium sp. 113-3-9]|uniref:hypothetical protein n=1 Tax=Mesorhizobium sp. 113-3-9 TaxID=2744517 RepID=UPI001FD17916|nr:hypothetical protein [Mesorhizobium sp. 113-3-9]